MVWVSYKNGTHFMRIYRHCSKYSMCINSFNAHNDPMRWYYFYLYFTNEENEHRKVKYLLKVTELKFELKQFGFYKKGKTEDICLCTQIHCFRFLLRKKYWVQFHNLLLEFSQNKKNYFTHSLPTEERKTPIHSYFQLFLVLYNFLNHGLSAPFFFSVWWW